MLDRIERGSVPAKHHIALRDDAGKLLFEECITRRGFDAAYTICYHTHRPHEHTPIAATHGYPAPEEAPRGSLKKHHIKAQNVPTGGAPIDARVPLMVNPDVTISVLKPDAEDPTYVVNGDGDDLYFIQEGAGVVRTVLGDVRFEKFDYVCVPKGIIHRFIPDEGPQFWLAMQVQNLGLLKQWRNETGQLRMDAPYCHRDFRRPDAVQPIDEGIRTLHVKRDDAWSAFEMPNNPLDVVGFDGTVYPWAFPITNFQPRAGLVHLPPTWHGTFQGTDQLICSFVPRVVDFHDEAIPCPYPHSSVDCDEFLFYCHGNFTSRKGIGPGSVSFHPMGIPHGPHPGAYERSMGEPRTSEMAVMIDTFKPLRLTTAAMALDDPDYMASFISPDGT